MIESKIIKFLDLRDSIQDIDVYSNQKILSTFRFHRTLLKYKNFPKIFIVILHILFYLQLCISVLLFQTKKTDWIVQVLLYLKYFFSINEAIFSKSTYISTFVVIAIFLLIELIFINLIFFGYNKLNSKFYIYIVDIMQLLIFYYLIGPVVEICLHAFSCDKGIHRHTGEKCYTNITHLIILIISIFMLIMYIFFSLLYVLFMNEIGIISTSCKRNTSRFGCNYEIYCLTAKIILYIIIYFIKFYSLSKFLFEILYEIFVFAICWIMTLYSVSNLYYYDQMINYLVHFGWFICSWFSFCVILNSLLSIYDITYLFFIGCICIGISLYKYLNNYEFEIMTNKNLLEEKNILIVEIYVNSLLNLINHKNQKNLIIIYGIIKKFEEYLEHNPEWNYYYQKLINDKRLCKKYNRETELPILCIIFIVYSVQLEKNIEISLYMCYFLVNKLNNFTFCLFLCSKLRCKKLLNLYYKYVLINDIKELQLAKFKNKQKKNTFSNIEISSVILYNIFIELFKLNIYDATSNQIEYFNSLKNHLTTSKTTQNFLKTGNTILTLRKKITEMWNKITELNPFSDEILNDYIIYLEAIIQDEVLITEESNKYNLLKYSKFQDKNNLYYNLYTFDKSAVILIDGYLNFGKILYTTPNFSFLFMYNSKEIINSTIDELLPNIVKNFHKELVDDALKFSNIKYKFKKSKIVLLKGKNGCLFSAKIYVKGLPNLSKGLIFISYIEKLKDEDLIFTLDKNFRITGFTVINSGGNEFTVNNKFNISQSIIGYHIGLIIPEILPLLNFKNNEFIMQKLDCDIKGNLYSNTKYKKYEIKVDNILNKVMNIKNINHNKSSMNDLEKIVEEEKGIFKEYTELMKLISADFKKPYNIFYKVELHSFLDDKFKYYLLYAKNGSLYDENNDINNKKNCDKKTTEKNISKVKTKEIKVINSGLLNNINKNNEQNNNIVDDNKIKEKIENSEIGEIDENHEILENEEGSIKKSVKVNENPSNLNVINKNNNNENNFMEEENNIQNNNLINKIYSDKNNEHSSFNKFKEDILNNKSMIHIKLMKLLGVLFGIISIAFMIYDTLHKNGDFNELSEFLELNLFLNHTKIKVAGIYLCVLNLKWLRDNCSISGQEISYFDFYADLLNTCMKELKDSSDSIQTAGKEHKEIFDDKYIVELKIYMAEEKTKYNLDLLNIIYFLINTGFTILDNVDTIIKDNTDFHTNNINSLIELSLAAYSSEIEKYNDLSNPDYINQKFKINLTSFAICGVLLLAILSAFIYLIWIINNLELNYLDELINLNSPNFNNYIKRLEEIKLKFRNDSNNDEEDEKNQDEIDMTEFDSKKDNDDNNKSKQKNEKEKEKENLEDKKEYKKRTKNKYSRNHQNKMQQIKKKKFLLMSKYFFKTNILFGIKIIIIMLISLSYYIISTIVESDERAEYLDFYSFESSIKSTFKSSFDVFINFLTNLNVYESQFENCNENINNKKNLTIPKSTDINIPTIGNLIIKINGRPYKKESKELFQELFNGDACEVLGKFNSETKEYCPGLWSGIMQKGLEQSLTQMIVHITSLIDELNLVNDGAKKFVDVYNGNIYQNYEMFAGYFMLLYYNITKNLFTEFCYEEVKHINKKLSYLMYAYIVITVFLCACLTFFIINFNHVINSLFNFIAIIPVKYLSEEENFFKQIINLGREKF